MIRLDAAIDLPTAVQDLLSAIDNNQFEVHYQPLVDVRDHSIYGVEALIRWNHPQRGLLKPIDFIQLAEETGLIVPIGSWVLRQACTDSKVLHAAMPDLLLSVNVSSRQLDEPDFLSNFSAILRETAIPHHLLQLEITESIFLGDSMRIGAIFHAIRSLGVKIAFDDFGTGFSSLNYLEKYPVDALKVDQNFVKNLGSGKISDEIVQHIVHLAKTIGVEVTAEGVERPEQAAALEAYGCNIAQGFLYSQPLPLRALRLILEQRSMQAFGGRRKDARAAEAGFWAPLAVSYAAG
jgi:EAL domain-containing protein (putative c-di-GMP-specific phosphodiesterase class I)